MFLLGSLPPEGVDVLTDEQIEVLIDRGSLVAVADADGTPVHGMTGVSSCSDLPFTTEEFWTCEASTVVFEEDYDDDGEVDPEGVYSRMVRRSFEVPDGDVTVELDAPVSPYDGTEMTSAEDLHLLTPYDGDRFLLDSTSGELLPVDDRPLLVGCTLDGEEDAAGVTLRTFDGGEREYRTIYDPRGVCDLDGAVVDPVEHFGNGNPVPEWFGLARPADPDDEEHGGRVDGVALWAGVDRVLRGVTFAD